MEDERPGLVIPWVRLTMDEVIARYVPREFGPKALKRPPRTKPRRKAGKAGNSSRKRAP